MDRGGRLLQPVTAQARSANARSQLPVPVRHGTKLPVLDSGLHHGRSRWLILVSRTLRGRASVAVPLDQRLPRGLGTWLVALLFCITGIYGVLRGDSIESMRAQYGEPRDILARMAGMGLSRITISGIAELGQREILNAAGITPLVSLPFLDVEAVRERVEAMPLVKEAAVRKLFPDELAIAIVERKPYALWQNQGEVFVVAVDGTVIDRMNDERFLGLPFVVGEGANERAKEFAALLSEAGPLRERIRAGILIGKRRWTLKLDNGLDVALPTDEPAQALARLSQFEQGGRLLGRDIIAVDLRQSDRIVVRLTEEAAAARADARKKLTGRGGQV